MTKRHSRSRRSKDTPGWMWMLLGLTLGLCVAGYVYISDVRAPRGAATPQARAPERQPTETEPRGSANEPEKERQAAASASTPPAAQRSSAQRSSAQRSSAQRSSAQGSSAQRSTAQTSAAQPSSGQQSASTQSSAGQTSAAQTPPAAPAAGARFQFYENLPQSEVVVPETAAVPATARTTTARTPEPTAIEPGSYLLQVGSFRTHADADRRKASIALLGYESQIQQATVNGDVVHRVLVGPIADQAALDTARRRFGAANFDTLVLKAAQ